MSQEKIVVLTGAGVSAESGLETFRGNGGLWHNHSVYEVASPEGWQADPKLVLDFYNYRRREVEKAMPNKAHLAIAELEKKYEVIVVTQNVDDLHERAGSTNVLHVHGKITEACSEHDKQDVVELGYQDIQLGDLMPNGDQMRPNIVWFGEEVALFETSAKHFKSASKVLVVGTSLSVFPVAGLVKKAKFTAEKILVTPDIEQVPKGYEYLRATACEMVPFVVNRWLGKSS